MDKVITNKIISNSDCLKGLPTGTKNKIRCELIKQFAMIISTADELGINTNDLWRTYLTKCDYNQLDNRERRSIMYIDDDEKADSTEKEKLRLRREYNMKHLDTIVAGYDMIKQEIRPVNMETEYGLVIFSDPGYIELLNNIIPLYVKFRIMKCTLPTSCLYFADIPLNCIREFPEVTVIIAPKKRTVLIGSNHLLASTYSRIQETSQLNFDVYTLIGAETNLKSECITDLHFAFVDAEEAEGLDDVCPNKFWFFENYNTKRKHHFIYSNSVKSQSKYQE